MEIARIGKLWKEICQITAEDWIDMVDKVEQLRYSVDGNTRTLRTDLKSSI
jgi:hypothetical protein